MSGPINVERPSFGEGYEPPAGTPFNPRPWSMVAGQLERSRNYWIITTRLDGRPHAAPLWGLWRADDALWFSTGSGSVKGRNLARDPRTVMHLESGDDVVVVEGISTLLTDEQAGDEGFLNEYAEKYDFRPAASDMIGAAWRLAPTSVLTWNEKDYVESQVKYRF